MLVSCGTDDITSEQFDRQQIIVESEFITSNTIQQRIELSGQLLPNTQLPILSTLPLEVKEVHVEMGQKVEKGDVLVTLDDKEARRQLNQAKEVLAQLERSLGQAQELNQSIRNNVKNLEQLQGDLQISIDRSRTLIEELDRNQLEDSLVEMLQSSLEVSLKQAELAQAASSGALSPVNTFEIEAQIQTAQNAVVQAEEAVQSTQVRSPISGVVSQLDVTKGQTSIPSHPLAIVSDITELKATFGANSFQITQLSPGLSATLSITGLDEEIESEISIVSPVVNPQTNTFTVTVPLKNDTMRLKGGMRTTAIFDLNQITEALVVPANAVLYEDGQPYVFVINENIANRQSVELGVREEDLIEVISGIEENQQVVTIGKERVTDGAEITIRNE